MRYPAANTNQPGKGRSWVFVLTLGFLLVADAVFAAGFESVEPVKPDLEVGRNKVVLKKEAYLRGPVIHLGDVADIEGVDAKKLASIELGPAASPGASKTVTQSLLRARLESAGYEPSVLKMDRPSDIVTKTLHLEVTGEVLTEDLRRFIENQMPWDPQLAIVDVAVPQRYYVVPDGDLEVVWRPTPTYEWLGQGALQGEIRVDGQVKRTINCRVNIDAYADVLVASEAIPRGTPVSAKDFEFRKKSLVQLKRGFLTDPAQIEGMVARSTIFPNEVVTKQDVELPRIVKRFQMISVETRVGSLMVRGRAKAMQHGCAGDTIRCKNENSDEEFFGTVREDGAVVVE